MLAFFSARPWRIGTLLGLLLVGRAAPAAGPTGAPPLIPLDSLRVRLARPGLADTMRVYYLTEIGVRLSTTDLPAARRYGNQAVALARQLDFTRGQAIALANLAAIAYYASDYPTAQRTFEAALRASQQARLPEQIGNAWLGLGNVAQEIGNIPRALQHFEQARASYAAMRPPSINGQILVLNNSSNAYNLIHQPVRSAQMLRQALALAGPATDPHLRVTLLHSLAGHQQSAGHLDSAKASLARGLTLARQTHDLQGEASLRSRLADVELSRAQPASAREQAARALALARQVGDPFQEEDALNALASALRALQRLDAYDTLRTYLTLHDTMMAHDRAEAIIEAQTRFDVAGQQARIRELEQQRRIARLEAERRALQTRWIVGWLAALAILVAAGLTWRYRRRQARHDAALRSRLAADLHDDVGSLLSQIALQSDLLQEGLTPPEQQSAQWAEVADSSRMAIRQLNDVVWNLDAHNDSLPNLLNRLRDYAHEVLVPTGRNVTFSADAALPAGVLPAPMRRTLYLIYKEALHNILKYAPADCFVEVTLRGVGPHLELSVTNDLPAGAPPRPERTSGHGLRNIRERALALGGTATTGLLPDGRFAVRVKVPLSGALRAGVPAER